MAEKEDEEKVLDQQKVDQIREKISRAIEDVRDEFADFPDEFDEAKHQYVEGEFDLTIPRDADFNGPNGDGDEESGKDS